MNQSFYRIEGYPGGCKVYFSDRRFDDFRPQVFKVFDILEHVQGYGTIDSQVRENILRKGKDCHHKCMGARYSLALIQQEISNKLSDDEVKNYSQIISSKTCNEAELKNEVLLYETESFLFQVKSNLDILIQLLKYVPNYRYLDTSGNQEREAFSTEDTAKIMRANGDIAMAELFEQQSIEWIRELNKLRNDITHRSGLTGFTSFVFDSGTEKVTDPKMPNGRLVEEYCSEIYEKLMAVYKKVFEEYILPKLQENKS